MLFEKSIHDLDYGLRTSIDLMKENDCTLKSQETDNIPHTLSDADYTDSRVKTHAQVECLLPSLGQATKCISLCAKFLSVILNKFWK